MANKETRIFQENTFEDFRQLTNEISLHLGDNELLNSLLTDKTFNYTAAAEQDIYNGSDNDSKTAIFEISPQKFVDNTGGYIILTGSPNVTAFTPSSTVYQGNLGAETFQGSIVSVTDKKILVSTTTGSFNPAVALKTGISDSIAAGNLVRLVVESYPVGIVRAYKNGTELEQSMGINGFHVANHSSNITVQNITTAIEDEFVEGTIVYQGSTQTNLQGVENNATWYGTILELTSTTLRIKTEAGTFSTGTLLKNLDGSETILAGDITAYSALDTTRGHTIVLNTPATASQAIKIFSMDIVAAVNELQIDVGQIENLDAAITASDLVGAINEHEKDLFGDPVLQDLTDLGTNDKDSFLDAINELETAIRGGTSGLVSAELHTGANDLLAAIQEHEAEMFGAEGGNKRNLAYMGTTNVNSIVDAIAELETAARGANNNYALTTTAQNFRDAIREHEGDIGNMTFTGLSATDISAALRELRTELGNHTTLTTDVTSNIVDAINELELAVRGQLTNYTLNTTADELVGAINEHETDLYGTSNVTFSGLSAGGFQDAVEELRTELGDHTTLGTNATGDAVSAINELEAAIRGTANNYTLGTDATDLVAGVNELETFARGANANYTLNTGSANVRDAINELEADLFNVEGGTKRTLASLGTTDKTSIVDAINELETATRGTLTNYTLNTGANNLVAAINEHEGDIGDMVLTGLTATDLSAAARELRTELGNVNTLDDAAGYTKTVASEAIVEIQGKIGNVTAGNMGTTASTVVTAISELEQEKVYLSSPTVQQISSPLEFFGNITYKSNTTLDTFTFENGTTLDLSAMGVQGLKLPGSQAEGRLDHRFVQLNGDAQVMGLSIDRAHVGTITDKSDVAIRWSETRAENDPARGWQLVGLNDSSATNTADIVTFYNAKNLISSNTEAGINVSWDTANQNFDFNVNDPTITLSGDVAGSATMTNLNNVTISTTIQPNSVALGTDTTGKYVTDIIGTANEVAIEATLPTPHNDDGAQYQIGLPQDVTISRDLTVTRNLEVTGNLTVDGTQTVLNTETLEVEDTLVLAGNNLVTEPTTGGFGLEVGPITSPSGVASNVTGAHSIVYNYANDRWEADGSLILSTATLETPDVEGTAFGPGDDLTFSAGAGLTEGVTKVGGLITVTYTNDDRGSAQNIFKNVVAGGVTITADSNNDTITITDDGVVNALASGTASDAIALSHADVLTDNLGSAGDYGQTGTQDGKYIKSLTLTAEGHVSAITTADFDTRYQATNPSWALEAQGVSVDSVFPGDTLDFRVATTDGVAGLTVAGGGTASDPNITYAHGNTSTISGDFGQTGAEDGTYIKSITIDALGHMTAVTSDSFDNRYMREWFLRDGDGTTLEINQNKYVQMLEGSGIDINFTDTTPGSNADPFDITITNTDRGSSQNIFKNVQIQNPNASVVATYSADSNNDTIIFREVLLDSVAGIELTGLADDIVGIAHANTSSYNSTPTTNAGGATGTVVTGIDVNVDTYGHTTGVSQTKYNLDGRYEKLVDIPSYTARSINIDCLEGPLPGTQVEVIDTLSFTSNTLGHVTGASATKRTLSLPNLGWAAWSISDGATSEIAGGTGATFIWEGDNFLTQTYTAADNKMKVGHPNSGVAAQTWGNSTTIPVITTDIRGHITGVTATAIPTYDNYSSWTLTADSGTNQTITSGNTVDIEGGTAISTAVGADGATGKVIITHENVSKTTSNPQVDLDITSTQNSHNLVAVSSITVNAQGHVTDIVTTDYDLDVSLFITGDAGNAAITLDGNDPDLVFSGGNNITTAVNGGTITTTLDNAITLQQVNLTAGDALSFESGKHWITNNDGQGDFNIRVAHKSNASGFEEVTEAGFASHLEFVQSSGDWKFKIAESSLSVGNTLSETGDGQSTTATWIVPVTFGHDSFSVLPNATFGGGYGSSGVTIESDGDIFTNGNVQIDGNLTVTGTTITNNVETVSTSNGVIFEGSAADANELTLLAGTLTADRTVTLPNASGTVALTSQLPTVNNGQLTVSGSGVLGGTGTFTANQSGNTSISISHDAVSRTNNSSTQSPAHGGNFTVIDSITTSTEGHVTAVNTKTVTLPSDNNTDTLQSIAANSTNANQYISFVPNTSGAQTGRVDAGLVYNPSSNILTATNVSTSSLLVSAGEGLEIKDGGDRTGNATLGGHTPNDTRVINLRDGNPVADGALLFTADASTAGDAGTELLYLDANDFEWIGNKVVTDGLSNSGRDFAVQVNSSQQGYVNVPSDNTDTTYSISAVDDTPNTDSVALRLTAGGSGSGTDDVQFQGSSDIRFNAPDGDTVKAFHVAGSVGNSILANMAANTVKVRDANSSGAPSNKVVADTQLLIGNGAGFTAASLSGDVTMNNAGAVTIANDAVTYAKMQNLSTANRLLGGTSAGNIGEVQVQTAMITADAVTYAKMQNVATANRLLGSTSSNGIISEVQVQTAMIAADAVTFGKVENIATSTILGRVSASSGNIEELTVAQAQTLLGIESNTNTTYAFSVIDNDDGVNDVTLRVAAGGSGSGNQDIEFEGNSNITFTSPGAGRISALITSNSVGNAKLADMSANTIKGAVSAGDPVDLTPAQVRTMINVADGAQVNVGTNITVTEGTSSVSINSSTGGDDSIAGATASAAGVVTTGSQSFAGKKVFGGGAKLNDNGNLTFGTGDDYLIDFTGSHLIIHQNVATTNDIEITKTDNATQFLFDVSDGNFSCVGDVTAFANLGASDAKFKDNIQVVEGALDKVARLDGVTFTWNHGEKAGQDSAGVIAQNVEEVMPTAVSDVKDLNSDETHKFVDHNQLTALFIEAIKELKQENAELRAMIEEMKK